MTIKYQLRQMFAYKKDINVFIPASCSTKSKDEVLAKQAAD